MYRTAEQFLLSYRNTLEQISELEEDIRSMEILLTKITPAYSDMPGGGDSLDSTREKQAKLGDLNLQLRDLKRLASLQCEDIRGFISRLGVDNKHDRKLRKYLRLYYCDLFSVDDCAMSFGIILRSSYRLKAEALRFAERGFKSMR